MGAGKRHVAAPKPAQNPPLAGRLAALFVFVRPAIPVFLLYRDSTRIPPYRRSIESKAAPDNTSRTTPEHAEQLRLRRLRRLLCGDNRPCQALRRREDPPILPAQAMPKASKSGKRSDAAMRSNQSKATSEAKSPKNPSHHSRRKIFRQRAGCRRSDPNPKASASGPRG